jgi:hypothetical protein
VGEIVLGNVVLVRDIRSDLVPYFRPASLSETQTTADVQIQQTFAFDDSEKQFIQTVREGEDPSHDWGSYSDVDLANWLERPILATTKIWNVGDPFPEIYFNPWSAFLDSPSVAQKLSNFYLLRCKMHMKVIVNGSQMHYGRGLISYRPLLSEPGEVFQKIGAIEPFGQIGYDDSTNLNLSNPEEVCIMTQSQWPKIFIDPGQSMGGEMEFPFFFGANWFRIPNRDWVANPSALNTGMTVPGGDGSVNTVNGPPPNISLGPYGCRKMHMGVVHSCNLAELKHANGADDPVTIQVFLWASDVKFSVPTAVPHPAVDALSVTSEAVFEPHMRSVYVPNFLGDLAKPASPDIAGRLEVGDSSLATDEATVGLGKTDEMSISAIAQRECWLDRFTWAVDDPAETPIWSCRVTPQYFKRQQSFSENVSGIPCMQPTPSAYASLPFGYWRGSMKYRIQVVASNLHRGRLRIVYDPVADIHARSNVNNYPESLMNQQYSRTVDIAGDSGRDFCFEVGYMQEKPYLSLLQLEARNSEGLNNQNFDWNNYGSLVPTPASGNRLAPTQTTNGQITIYVLNRLAVPATGPDINNDVKVNVFTSAGEDMDFQMPTARNLDMMSFVDPTGFPINWRNDSDGVPEALGNEALRRKEKFPKKMKKKKTARFEPHMDGGDNSAAMGATEMENVPTEPPTKAWMGDCSQSASSMSMVTFGEKMDSWMDLMNRWQLYNREVYCREDYPVVDSPDRGEDEYTVLTIIPDFPPFPGPAPMSSKWNDKTSYPSFPLPTVGPFIDGTSVPDGDDDVADNFAFNVAPAGKFWLNAPLDQVPLPGAVYADSATLLKVNPGQLTMMHFVSRMFLARKGAIRNKYILDGNTAPEGTTGTQIMSVKRLPDSGVISGNTYFGGDVGSSLSNAQNALETTQVRYGMPAYGGFWSQASCRVENASSSTYTSVFGAPNVAKAQALNGSMQTGTSNSEAPNWFNPLTYPAEGNYAPPLTQTTAVAGTVGKSDLMMSNTYDGTHVTTSLQQPVIEVEIPFYVNSRFIKNDLVLNNTRGVQAHVLKYETHLRKTLGEDVVDEASTITYFERHVRPGKDFALYYLANVPHIVMLGNFRYQTVAGLGGEGTLTSCAYGSLRYRSACRQSTSAYREPGITPVPSNTGSINTYPQDTYFYDLPILAQTYPLNIPSSAF